MRERKSKGSEKNTRKKEEALPEFIQTKRSDNFFQLHTNRTKQEQKSKGTTMRQTGGEDRGLLTYVEESITSVKM
jgi:hypothetical protein